MAQLAARRRVRCAARKAAALQVDVSESGDPTHEALAEGSLQFYFRKQCLSTVWRLAGDHVSLLVPRFSAVTGKAKRSSEGRQLSLWKVVQQGPQPRCRGGRIPA